MIKRSYARLCILLLCGGLFFIWVPVLLDTPRMLWLYIGSAMITAAFLVKYLLLRCPYCGWGGAVPQWSKSGNIHCPKCGKAATYDR